MNSATEILERPMQNPDQIAAELHDRLSSKAVIRRNESLAPRTTMRVGGPADFYVEPASDEDLAALLKCCGEHEIPIFMLGRGSNLVVRDGGFRGVVICLAHPHFNRIEIDGERLRCGAGARLKLVAVEAKRHDLSGLEFLEGIPGGVGGALRMNAGAMGGAVFDVVESVRFMDYSGCIGERVADEIKVEYRSCDLLKDRIALSAVLKGAPDQRGKIEARMNSFSRKRWETQPAAPSAGCVFKNPAEIPAGKLIEELGLKGARVGGAVVSSEHGNFIVNDGNATARDVLELVAVIKARANIERGIKLQTEVQIIGEDIL